MDFKGLEDYGIIGNLETSALVGRDGSIDWLCFPFTSSSSVFAALLDPERGGQFRIRPQTKYQSIQSYLGQTNILRTTFTTPLGDAVITDFMPLRGMKGLQSAAVVFRKVECLKGMMKLSVSFRPRFNYGAETPEVGPAEGGLLSRWQGESLFLQAPATLFLHDGEASGSVALKAGDSLWFTLQYNQVNPFQPEVCDRLLETVQDLWLDWAGSCDIDECLVEEPWHYLAIRSALTLKLLSDPETGAIAAAPTTSLPEKIGGSGNWDYRYAWIRHTAFIDQALFHLGHIREAQDFRKWLIGIAEQAATPSDIQTVYPLHGKELGEKVLEHLSGYEGSSPARVGNAASEQKSLDIFGEILNALYDSSRHGEKVSRRRWEVFRAIVSHVCTIWEKEDSGIWEMRDGLRHFVYSKLMCWVAIDRGIKIAEEQQFDAPLEEWRKIREIISQEILARGFSEKLGSFVQSFGSDRIDATGLLIAPMGLLSPNDPKVLGTIDAVMERLMPEYGLVFRYEEDSGPPEGEGCFFLCSFWLIKALILSGRVEEAEKMFAAILGYVSPLGLLSERVEPGTGRLVGNFPHAFSHVGLVNSALYIGIAKGRQHKGPLPLGVMKSSMPSLPR